MECFLTWKNLNNFKLMFRNKFEQRSGKLGNLGNVSSFFCIYCLSYCCMKCFLTFTKFLHKQISCYSSGIHRHDNFQAISSKLSDKIYRIVLNRFMATISNFVRMPVIEIVANVLTFWPKNFVCREWFSNL